MTRIWYCRTCGYEVDTRGRCHNCRQRLTPSPLPELEQGEEDDEVGYRLEGWSGRSRGRLIDALVDAGILHRFEEEELVVAADDEARTDDLVEAVSTRADGADDEADVFHEDEEEAAGGEEPEVDEAIVEQVQALYAAAGRLQEDPTDMQADGDVAEASAVVFVVDSFPSIDPDTWAAVGRVTRRLLAALGADEALEDEIKLQAGILVKLLEPVMGPEDAGVAGDAGNHAAGTALEGEEGEEGEEGDVEVGASPAPVASEGLGNAAGGEQGAGDVDVAASSDDEGEGAEEGEEQETGQGEEEEASEDAGGEPPEPVAGESVYELPEWLPEQRAELSVYLDDSRIPHSWEGGDLVVPLASEEEVESLFDRVQGVSSEEDEGARYRALEELFAATDRLANDPASTTKANEVVRAVEAADGPTPLGLDDAQWWSIRNRARSLADAIEGDAHIEVVHGEAVTLRDMLRVLV